RDSVGEARSRSDDQRHPTVFEDLREDLLHRRAATRRLPDRDAGGAPARGSGGLRGGPGNFRDGLGRRPARRALHGTGRRSGGHGDIIHGAAPMWERLSTTHDVAVGCTSVRHAVTESSAFSGTWGRVYVPPLTTPSTHQGGCHCGAVRLR